MATVCALTVALEWWLAAPAARAGSARDSVGGGREASSQSATSGGGGRSDSPSTDSGSDSSSSSDDGGGRSDDSGASESCVETSWVVGRRRCTRFAAWDVTRIPRVQVGLGTTLHSFPVRGLRFDGGIPDLGVQLDMDGAAASRTGRAAAIALDMRATVLLGQHVYVGGEADLGKVMLPARELGASDALQLAPSGSLYFAGGALLGVRAEVRGKTLRAEALLGGRLVGLNLDGTLTEVSCRGSTSESAQSMVTAGEALVQPRVALEHWLSPWLTVGASVGANVLHARDYSVGVFVQVHPRAFDATRHRPYR